MKKLFFFLFFLVLSPVVFAQSYSDYLQAAKRHLKNGNVEKARLTYNIYKDLTGKKDAYLEGQLNPAKAETPRKKSKTPSVSKDKVPSNAKAPSAQQGQSVPTSRTFTVNGVSFRMVYVQGGTFRMGSESYEQPVHSVTLSDYYIGETEVTQQLWHAVMGSNPSHFTGNSQRPVEKVSWDDCQTFIRRLNDLTGKDFRLPTEAEWEYAARGGNKSRGYKYSGSNTLSDVAWYDDNASGTTHRVKQKRANELGLYDMSGNVWEWCQDWYFRDYYSQSPSYNPAGPNSGSNRVNRGGSWFTDAIICRVARRNCNIPGNRYYYLGLRLALTPRKETSTSLATSRTLTVKDKVASSSKTQVSSAPPVPQQDKHTSSTSRTFIVKSVSFKMVYVQGDTIDMGSNDSEAGDDEQPVHSVTLSDYYIGETEVTQQLWHAVMGSNPSDITGDSQRPVEGVSWDDCQTFIRKLNELTGKSFRLPTEAEWEYAARGGNKSRGYKYSGSNTLSDVAWYEDNAFSTTHPVKQKCANELGLYDMSGNVYEWCQDRYDSDYYSQSPSYNPAGPDSGSYRVIRGGGWNYGAMGCRVANRNSNIPGNRYINLGLRLAL